jgi:hypothetical protein
MYELKLRLYRETETVLKKLLILIKIDKCNKMLCLSSRNMIDKTMCEVLWWNISDFYVNLRVEEGKHPQVILEMYLKHTDNCPKKSIIFLEDKHNILLHLSIFMSINSFFNTVSVSRYCRNFNSYIYIEIGDILS